MYRALVGTFLCLSMPQAWALSLDQAGQNLTYFAYVHEAAAYCEIKGYSTATRAAQWQKKYSPVLNNAASVIKEEGARKGLGAADQEYLIAEFMNRARNQAKNAIAKDAPPCREFDRWLDQASSVLIP